jgi:hypothetical protein
MEESSAPTSKKGAKKAEAKAKKEALKAQRAAELAAGAAAINLEDDPAKDNYGNRQTTTSAFSQDAEEVEIRSLDETYDGKTVVVRAWLQKSRVQSAKMGFVELRKGGNWNIQGVIVASEEEPVVSRRMVKWVTSINPESFVAVEAKVKKPLEPVKSCRVSGVELHITKCFVLASAPAMLGMTMGAASQPIVNFSDESATQVGDVDTGKVAEAAAETTVPAASMLTHLDNIAMHKRAPVQQAIAVRRRVGDGTMIWILINTWHRISGSKSRGSSAHTSKPAVLRNLNRPASSAQRLRAAQMSFDSRISARRPFSPNHPSSTNNSRLQEAGSVCSA